MFSCRFVWRGVCAGFGVFAVVVVFCAAAFAASPEPPELRVEPVFAASAMFVGVLNPHAGGVAVDAGSYQFVYRAAGSCTGAGEKVLPASPASAGGQPAEVVSLAVAGLAASTEYTVCLVAENGEGRAVSSPVSFVTKAAGAPEVPEVAVEGHVPSPASPSTEAVLRGVLNPGAVEAMEPGSYRFVYRQTSDHECVGAGEKLTAPSAALGLVQEPAVETITGLAPGSEYAACLLETLNDGKTARSAPVSFMTAVAPQVPETASPATEITQSSVMVAGVLNPTAVASAGWHFGYSNAGGGSCTEGPETSLEAEVEGQSVAVGPVKVSGLEPHAIYKVCLVASNGAGEQVRGNEVLVETLGAAPVVGEESVPAITSSSATLQAIVNPGNEATTFSFQYSTEKAGETLVGTVGVVDGGAPLVGFGEQSASVETGSVLAQDTSYFYRVIAKNAKGEETLGKLQVFSTLPETPENVQASGVTGSSATLSGVLNASSKGEPGANYEFLYQAGTETECEAGKQTSGTSAGGSPEPVQAQLTGLTPNTAYAVCLRVRNGAGQTAISSPPVAFTTLAVPLIEGGGSSNETESAADVQAGVNPDGSLLTSCVFEYTTSSYAAGQQVPCSQSPQEIGAGTSLVSVTAALSGLHPNMTYHWRLTAGNAAGSNSGVDHTFIFNVQNAGSAGCPQEQARQESNSTRLPDCRAYEMVTPPDKNGSHIEALFAGRGPWGPMIAGDGMDLIAPSIQCFADAESCTGIRTTEGQPYEFARTSQGWVTHPLAPPASTYGISSQLNEDADLHTTLFSAPGSPNQTRDHFYLREGLGTPQDIGPLGEHAENSSSEELEHLKTTNLTAGTADFSHVLFNEKGEKAQPPLWSLDGTLEEEPSVYEYAGQDTGRPLSVGVAGGFESTNLVSPCGTYLGSGADPYVPAVEYGSLSADGHVVFFTALGHDHGPTCPVSVAAPSTNQLYARVDGETPGLAHTVAVSTPTPGVCVSPECQASQSQPQDADFEGASADGSRVFFTSTQQLTDTASQGEGEAGEKCSVAAGSGCNLYESVCAEPCGTHAEEPAAKERELIDVSAGAKAHGGPRVRGVMAISSDGSHVYFIARGKLATNTGVQGTTAQEGQANLYVHAQGAPLRFIATLPASDEEQFEQQDFKEWTGGVEVANVTPDGQYLVFLSHGALTADDTRPEGPAQIYRYDDAGSGSIVRVTIGQNGYNDNGNAGTAGAGEPNIVLAAKGWQSEATPADANPTMSDDGQYVFFESPVALAPGALNEVPVNPPSSTEVFAQNIYEYHDGEVYLISDGKDVNPNPGDIVTKSSTRLVGTDASGKNVFFWTTSQVTSQDTDTQRDIYDARICETGDPCIPPPAPPASCQGEECELPAGSPPGPVSLSGSNTLQGTGNAPPGGPPSPGAKVKVLTRSASTRGTHFALRLSVNEDGRITISGGGVKKITRSVKAAGTQTLTITLTPAARSALHHKHKVTFRLRVVFTPAAGRPVAATVSVTAKL